MGIGGLLFNLVANCNVKIPPDFCFQNCNKCWIVFPKLTIIRVSCVLFSVCALGGINTLHGQPCLPISILNAFAMASYSVAHVPSISHLPFPIPSNHPIYMPPQKSNVKMISKEITISSNWISDLPEEIRISRNIKPIIEM